MNKTSISDEKVKEILIDGINKASNYILNKTIFYEHIRTIHKIEKQRCLRLYDLHYKNAQEDRNKLKTELGIEEEKKSVKNDILSKTDAMEILTKIAKTGEKDADKRNAIETLAKFEGWNAPTKSETDLKVTDNFKGFSFLPKKEDANTE